MISLDNGDKIRGDASAATVVDYILSGTDANAIKQLADGQLPAAIGDLYTADSVDAVTSIILVNTDSVARTVNLYLTPSGGAARRLIPKDMSLGIGHSLYTDGRTTTVMDALGNVLSTVTASAHALGSSTHTADTLSNLNTKISDATLVDTGDITLKVLFNAQTILAAVNDNDPVPLTVAASRFVGRKASGNIAAMTGAEAIALLSGANLDVGAYNVRGATLTADGLTSGRVVFAGASGLLSDDGDFTFSVDTLTVTKIGAFEAVGAINFGSQNMTNVNIDSGAIGPVTLTGTLTGNAQIIVGGTTPLASAYGFTSYASANSVRTNFAAVNPNIGTSAGVSYIAYLADDGGAAIAAGRIVVVKSGTWEAASAPTKDANMELNVAVDGSLTTYLTLRGDGNQDILLSKALTLNGQVFDAGSGRAQINTTGGAKGLLIQSTNNGSSGVELEGYQISASPAAGNAVCILSGYGRDSSGNKTFYSAIEFLIEDPTHPNEDGKMSFWNLLNNSLNNVMRINSEGIVWADVGFDADEYFKVAGTQVVSARGAAVANPTDPASTQARLTDLLGRLRTHGLIAV